MRRILHTLNAWMGPEDDIDVAILIGFATALLWAYFS